MNIKIISDSGCDMSQREAKESNLTILPLKTLIDGIEYRDGIDIMSAEFYEKLDCCQSLPSTSQVTPAEYADAYSTALESADDILVITIGAKLSGTFQSANIAAADFPGKIHVLDSGNVAAGQRILVDYALRLRDQGCSINEMLLKLEQAKRRLCIIARVDTLEYLKRGGRLSKTAAIAGSILNIKPVLGLENGEIVILGKARGSKAGNNLLTDLINKQGGVDFSMPYMLVYSGNDDALLKGYIDNSRCLWEGHTGHLPISIIGSTIGTHVGPGAIGVAFFSNYESHRN